MSGRGSLKRFALSFLSSADMFASTSSSSSGCSAGGSYHIRPPHSIPGLPRHPLRILSGAQPSPTHHCLPNSPSPLAFPQHRQHQNTSPAREEEEKTPPLVAVLTLISSSSCHYSNFHPYHFTSLHPRGGASELPAGHHPIAASPKVGAAPSSFPPSSSPTSPLLTLKSISFKLITYKLLSTSPTSLILLLSSILALVAAAAAAFPSPPAGTAATLLLLLK